jgi:hypothetical protein
LIDIVEQHLGGISRRQVDTINVRGDRVFVARSGAVTGPERRFPSTPRLCILRESALTQSIHRNHGCE